MKEFIEYTKAFFAAILTQVLALVVSLTIFAYYCLTIYTCFVKPASLEASMMFIIAMLIAFKSVDFLAWIYVLTSKNLDDYLNARERFLKISSA